jgi:predicted enzyme related to lactoylglutathione lyase
MVLACVGLASAFAGEPPQLPPLTTVARNPRLPGKFVWADLVTDNAPTAQKFYGALFGWAFYDCGGYVVGRHDDRPVCGIFQRPRPTDRQAEPRWFGYISVNDLGRAERVVKQAGGRVMAPVKQVPKRGAQAVFADAEGALFGVVKSSSGDPEDFLAEPGEWIWIQLLSRDARKAADFYHAVAGYEVIENTQATRASDFVLASEGYARATIRTIRSSDTQVKPTWLPFVRVLNVAESVARARELGGKTLIEPKPELFHSKVAVIADPTGAAIGLLEWSADLMKGGG